MYFFILVENGFRGNYQSYSRRKSLKKRKLPTLSIQETSQIYQALNETQLSRDTYKNSREADLMLEKTLPGFHSRSDRLGLIDYDEVIDSYRSRIRPAKSPSSNRSAYSGSPLLGEDDEEQLLSDNTENKLRLPGVLKTRKVRSGI